MAQNVTIAGASYLGVPRIEMPKTGGGTAVFVDTSDANAAAGDITKGKTAYVGGTKITGTLEASSSGGAKETWVIKGNAAGELVTTQISFTSNGQKFTSIGTNSDSSLFVILYYDSNEIAGYDPGVGGVHEFDNEAYRKLTFDTPPTGALLTWLQSNATKQPDDTAVQGTKALTITSNGTVSVTPDAPYDGLSSVDVTVDVASGGGGTTIPGIVELFTTSGLHYSPEYGQTIKITFSAWPNYFGVYCTDGEYQNIFIGPSVYLGNMAGHLTIVGAIEITDVNFNDGVVFMQIYEYVNYYFLSDVEMAIETQ